MTGRQLFEALVDRSDLGAVAPFALARMLRRVGILKPETELTVEGLRQALPHIFEVIQLYLTPPAAARAMDRIRELVSEDASIPR